MLDIKVSLDEYEIIHSSIAHVKNGSILKFEIEELITYIEIIFDKEKTAANMEFYPNGANSVIIKLINFKNPSGSGVMSPWQIGFIDNRLLYISFSINYSEDYSLFSYCFYLGKEEYHGQ